MPSAAVRTSAQDAAFEGPSIPSGANPGMLACACWALSLLTEFSRGVALQQSPLARLQLATVCSEDLLGLAPPAALDQLSRPREQAEQVLLPALRTRRGAWIVGPTFDGSVIMNADADLVAAGVGGRFSPRPCCAQTPPARLTHAHAA